METIRTDQPLMQDRPKMTREIADFWNKTSLAWKTVWGPHIHHGYFENHGENPVEAQEKLIEKLVAMVDIAPRARILDAGCGMGGSSLYLAKKFGAKVTGITLSQTQVEMARQLADEDQIQNVSFQVEDALAMSSFSDQSFDLVWSLESCEQFFDKQIFLNHAFRVLKPGGRLMLATWCSGADEYSGSEAKKYRKLCTSLQLPYMPTIDRYAKFLQQQGFIVEKKQDWSTNVHKTWAIGLESLRQYSLFKIFQMSGWRGLIFGRQGQLMQNAFDQHRVTYGVFVARKP
ncbi:MAG: methyltransferase domain-containing protein [Pseudobdellovibrionaceae bacterium]